MPVPAGPGGPPPVPGDPIYYDPILSRVRITVDGLSDLAPVTVQRSTNEVTWTTVRGGVVTPSGGTIRVDDYEFAPSVLNYYRVLGPTLWDGFGRTASSGWDDADSGQTYTTSGGSASDASVSGGTGRLLIGSVNTFRNVLVPVGASDVEYTVRLSTSLSTPTGAAVSHWFLIRAANLSNYYVGRLDLQTSGNMGLGLFSRVAGVGGPTIASTVTDGVNTAGDWWEVTVGAAGSRLYASARNLTTGGAGVSVTGTDGTLTSGNNIGMQVRAETGNGNGAFTVQYDNLVVNSPQATLFTGSITPTIDMVWLKSVARPFLNRAVDIRDQGPISRAPRTGVFDIVGRSRPVAVSDLRRSATWTIDLRAETPAEADTLDLVFASGDTLLVQVPSTGPLSIVRGGYVTVGTTARSWLSPFDDVRIIEMPCTEVAAPGPDVVGATLTCQTVLNTYATCADLLAAQPTCADLLTLIGDPTDIVVE